MTIFRCRIGVAAALAAVLVLSGAGRAAAVELSHEIRQMYAATNASPPTASQMMICYGFVCRLRAILHFGPGDRAAIRSMMAAGQGSPAAERKAVGEVVRWFDRRAGKMVGTARRVPRADFRNRDDDGNFDCFDTTRNTVSLLLVLREWKLLRHHTVGDPKFRGNILVGQTPHNTAVLIENKTRQSWVVDMWTTGYNKPPDVMTLDRWVTLD
ncbi:MAG: hypothetical protein FJX62_14480 [Alphaproteobacteria bacterium]|nr:hypothetical protein [Alphaproteobacteria bacterium]